MKFLYKRITTTVNGYNGDGNEYTSFVCTEKDPVSDEIITQEDVIEADQVFLEYDTYELIGPIIEEELSVLEKFKILA